MSEARPEPILPRIGRVLVRCPNWLGDTVMAVPALRALRAAAPAAELWCLGPWAPSILIDEPGITRRLDVPRGQREWLGLVRELRRAGVDLVLLLPNSFGTALFARAVGARWRVGYAADARACMLTHAVRPPPHSIHQVEAYLALLRPLGVTPAMSAPTLHIGEGRRAEARRLLAAIGIRQGDRPVAIQLGAGFGPSKVWASERLASLATRLDKGGIPAVFLGAPEALPLLRSVQARMSRPAVSLVGRDHPAILAPLLAEFSVVVAPDSGPAHVAAAVGVPVVTLFGPTDPRLTAPVGPRHTALWRPPVCAPCFRPRCPIDHRCLDAITVDEVESAVRRSLEAAEPSA